MNGPTIGALCAGYGGLDQAVQQVLGGEVIWVSEFEAAPASILAHHYPDAPNHGDLTRIDWAQVEPVDFLTAGFPCQPVSTAGGRKGINDKRWLFDDITRALRVMDPPPRLCVFENVLGLLSANSGHAMARVVEGLASVGYVGTYRVLAASDVGAPHRRKRVFIVAWPADADSPGPQGAQPAPGLLESHRGSAADAEGHGRHEGWTEPAGIVRGPDATERGGADVTLLPTPAVNDMGAGKTVEDWDAWTARMQAEHGNGNGHGKSLHIEAARLLPTPMVGSTSPASHGQISGQYRDAMAEAFTRWGDYAPAIARWEALTRPAPAPTHRTNRQKQRTPPIPPLCRVDARTPRRMGHRRPRHHPQPGTQSPRQRRRPTTSSRSTHTPTHRPGARSMTHPPALTAPILTPAWTDDALCAQTGYGAADEWYPERGESYTAALKLCQGCPVREECLEFAMTTEASDYHRHGIFGGTTPRTRRRIAAQRAQEAA